MTALYIYIHKNHQQKSTLKEGNNLNNHEDKKHENTYCNKKKGSIKPRSKGQIWTQ